jgi:ABC-type nitrate/sulfonate/bicarbonate transport system substrate-binding protein
MAAAAAGQALEKVTAVIPQNSVFVLNWIGAKDAGVFTKYGIDLTVDVRPFAGFLASLPSKQTPAVTYSGMEAVEKMNNGLPWQVIGGGLTVIQDIFVRHDSPIKSIQDLRGKRLGTWSTGAGAYISIRAAVADAAGFDLEKDTKLAQLAPPALFKLLQRGDVDAMINISSFTMKAFAEQDKFRSIFSANDYWRQKTGYPIVWTAPLIAWKSWVDENPARARNYSAAVEESFRWLRKPENFDAAVQKHGALAGVTTAQAIATYKKLLSDKRIFLAEWNPKVVDAEWRFLDMAKSHGVLKAVPDKNAHAMIFEQ